MFNLLSSRKQPVRTNKRKMSRERKNNKQNDEGFCLGMDSKTKSNPKVEITKIELIVGNENKDINY